MRIIETSGFTTPPVCQGQVVTRSYAQTEDGYTIERRDDASLHPASHGRVSYRISRTLAADEGDYWNGPPRNKRWRTMTRAEERRYGLD